ncbi:MAG: YigZ family protein [Bacteroidales bacterium]|nr:YigZ family protein [Bacteroidales bacterium]
MLSDDTYKTINKKSLGYYKDRGSKFIAVAVPVSGEEQAKGELEKIRKTYHDARHHCYAYRLGWDYASYRINDDGEPSGSAGKPIFGQIRSYELTNVLIVVVRYFGGVKLGVRGLIDAYKGATQEALQATKIVNRTVKEKLHIHFKYPQMGKVMHIIKENNLDQIDTRFQIECDLDIAVQKSKGEEFAELFRKIEDVTVESKGLL